MVNDLSLIGFGSLFGILGFGFLVITRYIHSRWIIRVYLFTYFAVLVV